eukprot:gene23791-28841_t
MSSLAAAHAQEDLNMKLTAAHEQEDLDMKLIEAVEAICAIIPGGVLPISDIPCRVPHLRRMLKDRKIKKFIDTRPDMFEVVDMGQKECIGVRALRVAPFEEEGAGPERREFVERFGLGVPEAVMKLEQRIVEAVTAAIDESGPQKVPFLVRRTKVMRRIVSLNKLKKSPPSDEDWIPRASKVGTTLEGAAAVSDQLRNRTVEKRYMCLVNDQPTSAKGEVKLLVSSTSSRLVQHKTVVSPHGKEAHTRWEVITLTPPAGVIARPTKCVEQLQ